MVNFRQASANDIPQAKELWKRCFGDADAYVDMFFQKYCVPEQVLVVEEDGEINSMATMLETTLHCPDGEEYSIGYVYALATNPYIQGQGHARQLLSFADDYAKKKGMKGFALVPASPSLHRYFENLGLVECYSTRKVEKLSSELTGVGELPEDCKMTPILPGEYNEIRRQQIGAEAMYVDYTDKLVQFQQFGSHLTAGDLYRLEIDGEVGCVSIEFVQRSRLLMKELLISTDKMEKAVQMVAKEFPAARYHMRTPADREGMQGSYVQHFGMMKWYDRQLQEKWFSRQDAYLGLAFD